MGLVLPGLGVLPYRVEEEPNESGMTALGGLPAYLDLASVLQLREAFEKYVPVDRDGQGYCCWQMGLQLVMLKVAGGDCMADLDRLNADSGVGRVLRRVEFHKLPRRERREIERRWRKERQRNVASPSSGFRFLAEFHDREQEELRRPGAAFIPAPNAALQGLPTVNGHILAGVQKQRPQAVATLDMDATLTETYKAGACYCYQKYKACQPLNIYWFEQGMILHSELRDGNVPAGYQQLRVLKELLTHLPAGVEKVRLRCDTAGYDHELLRYCARGENEKYGVIEFSVGVDITQEFRKEVLAQPQEGWKPLKQRNAKGEWVESGKEYLEVPFVPNAIAHRLSDPEYRYVALREVLVQPPLPGMEDKQLTFPLPTLEMAGTTYKLHGICSNDWEKSADELVEWSYERCGKSEEAQGVLKEDFGGGRLPSGDFGENAAWWWFSVLAMNLNEAMKRVVLRQVDPSLAFSRMKAIRFALAHLPGRVFERSKNLYLRFSKGHPGYTLMVEIRRIIAELQPVLVE